jgi:hypothetical protein
MKLLIYLAVTFAFTILVEWQIEVRKALAPGPGSPPPRAVLGPKLLMGCPAAGSPIVGSFPLVGSPLRERKLSQV